MAERSLPLDAEHLRRLASDVSAMTDALCELRAGGRGVTPPVLFFCLRDFVQKVYLAGREPCQEHPEQAGRGGGQCGAGREQASNKIEC